MAVLVVVFWRAKTRLLVLKLCTVPRAAVQLCFLSICSVTIATALSLLRAYVSEIPSHRITEVITSKHQQKAPAKEVPALLLVLFLA